MTSKREKCRVVGCKKYAYAEVFLYDMYLYPRYKSVFFERDFTCPFICLEHMAENELQAKTRLSCKEVEKIAEDLTSLAAGKEPEIETPEESCAVVDLFEEAFDERVGIPPIREYKGRPISYPYTNKHRAQGFTIYRPLEK